MLQKFVYSKSSKNQVIKCEWSNTKQIVFERACNLHSMYDQKVDASDRVTTFEVASKKNNPNCSYDKAIPESVQNCLLEAIFQIKDHLYHKS